jgi:uncharacterized cupin superfamily protein
MEEGTSRARILPAAEDRFVPLRRQLGVTAFGINEIVLTPGQRGRIHRHGRQEEVFLVLAGTLTISIEGEEEELGQGELIRVAPAVRRQLINSATDELILLAIGGDGSHEGRDGEAFTSWEETDGASPRDVPLPEDLQPPPD